METAGEDRKVEILIGFSVRLLVLAAASIAGMGGILYLHRLSPQAIPSYGVFESEPATLRGVTEVVKYALTFDARGLMQLGILFLIAIPVIRVIIFAASFAMRRDWLYCIITGIVCAILLFSLIGGKL
jgi:uncharacterized membrane protein